jgi:hypothetical protein
VGKDIGSNIEYSGKVWEIPIPTGKKCTTSSDYKDFIFFRTARNA